MKTQFVTIEAELSQYAVSRINEHIQAIQTIITEDQLQSAFELEEKQSKRGRPKGSKNRRKK